MPGADGQQVGEGYGYGSGSGDGDGYGEGYGEGDGYGYGEPAVIWIGVRCARPDLLSSRKRE